LPDSEKIMPRRLSIPDFRLLEGVVAPRILDAARSASKTLSRLNVRHALIGGLAVGAYGYVRATKDVDFLVGSEGFEHHSGGILTFKPGIPIEINGVVVDILESDERTEEQVDDPLETEGIPIVDPEALIYLKLLAFRRRDKEDVVQLLREGLDEKSIRAYLDDVAPDLIGRFDELANLADEEE
jgi:hypothetical protein